MSTAVYRCDMCGAIFENENLAEKCENNHVEMEFILPIGTDEKEFCIKCQYNERLEYPSEIVVKKNENIQAIYKLITF
jgi:hypothetical protein